MREQWWEEQSDATESVVPRGPYRGGLIGSMIGPNHRCPGGLLRFALDDHLSMRIYPHAYAALLSEAAPDPLHTPNDTDVRRKENHDWKE